MGETIAVGSIADGEQPAAQRLYREREQRLKDAIALRTLDRVPIIYFAPFMSMGAMYRFIVRLAGGFKPTFQQSRF